MTHKNRPFRVHRYIPLKGNPHCFRMSLPFRVFGVFRGYISCTFPQRRWKETIESQPRNTPKPRTKLHSAQPFRASNVDTASCRVLGAGVWKKEKKATGGLIMQSFWSSRPCHVCSRKKAAGSRFHVDHAATRHERLERIAFFFPAHPDRMYTFRLSHNPLSFWTRPRSAAACEGE